MQINGASLRAIRERSGWTTSGLARAAGVGHSHIANVEAGRRQLSPDIARRIADILGVPLAAITSDYTPEQITGKTEAS